VARRRDPAGLKADFEQFWTWKKRPTTKHPSIKHGRIGTPLAPPAANGIARHPVKNGSFFTAAAGGNSSSGVALSKLEVLTRMKAVYMAKGNTCGECAQAATTAGSPNPPRPQGRPSLESHPPDDTSNVSELVDRTRFETPEGTGETMDSMKQRSRCSGGESFRSCESLAGRGPDDFGTRLAEEDAMVNVPDLELTDTRMKLVEKYFRGGGGGGVGVGGARWHQRRSVGQEGQVKASVKPAGSIVRSSLGREHFMSAGATGNVGHNEGNSSSETHDVGVLDDSFGDRTGNSSSCAGDVGGEARLRLGSEERIPLDETIDSTTSGRLPAAPVSLAIAPAPPPLLTQGVRVCPTAFVESRRQDGGVLDAAEGGFPDGMALSSEKGRLPVDADSMSQPLSEVDGAVAVSPPATVAPAWCADSCSLEDLVYWTKGLDYDAAVKGI
ncbi:unnamed protein product, partial [Hapterophycus canaliculatus]